MRGCTAADVALLARFLHFFAFRSQFWMPRREIAFATWIFMVIVIYRVFPCKWRSSQSMELMISLCDQCCKFLCKLDVFESAALTASADPGRCHMITTAWKAKILPV